MLPSTAKKLAAARLGWQLDDGQFVEFDTGIEKPVRKLITELLRQDMMEIKDNGADDLDIDDSGGQGKRRTTRKTRRRRPTDDEEALDRQQAIEDAVGSDESYIINDDEVDDGEYQPTPQDDEEEEDDDTEDIESLGSRAMRESPTFDRSNGSNDRDQTISPSFDMDLTNVSSNDSKVAKNGVDIDLSNDLSHETVDLREESKEVDGLVFPLTPGMYPYHISPYHIYPYHIYPYHIYPYHISPYHVRVLSVTPQNHRIMSMMK